MSDKYCDQGDPENPLLQPRPPPRYEQYRFSFVRETIRKKSLSPIGEAIRTNEEDRNLFFVLIGFTVLFVTMSAVCIFGLTRGDPRSAVFVSSLNASSNGDTNLSISYPVYYFKDLNATYEARASLQSGGNASVSAAATTMYYSSDKLFLHALFDSRVIKEDVVVDLDLTVEANVTLVYGREMWSYMTIRCNNLKIEFERGAGRQYDSGGLCRVRTYRNGEWLEGVRSQLLIEYVISLYNYLHPTWESAVRDPFNFWVRGLHREASAALIDADAWIN